MSVETLSRKHAASIPESIPIWHTLDQPALETLLETGGDGLVTADAQHRLARYGPNELEEAPLPGTLTLLLRQLRSPLIYLLLLAMVVSMLLAEFIDMGVIALVIVLDAVIGFTQERRAEISVRALARLVAPRARVIRDGREWELESRELVPGDLVLLESGIRVPADMRLIAATALMVDESLLTGESIPAVKRSGSLEPDLSLADRRNMVYAGTTVTSGRGRGYVVATGGRSELGTIATEIRTEEQPETLLQHQLNHLARIITIVVIGAAIAVLAIGVALGNDPGEMIGVAVAAGVSAIPEGLPIAFTVTLAVGVRRMARRNAIIRRLPAVETLGSTNVIGSDKTGTLTENRMTVEEIWTAGGVTTIGEHVAPAAGDDRRVLREESPLYLTLFFFFVT